MAVDFLMFVVPRDWDGEFYTKSGNLKKTLEPIFWKMEPEETPELCNRVDDERFSFGGDGIDNAQKITGNKFLSVCGRRNADYIYPLQTEEAFSKILEEISKQPDSYTKMKLHAFFRNIISAIAEHKERLILVAW